VSATSQTEDGSDTHHVVDDPDGVSRSVQTMLRAATRCPTGKSASRLFSGCPAPLKKYSAFPKLQITL
jgi:hypothetical protein